MKASDIDPTKHISILMKGIPGEGKTIAAASFAVLGDIHIAYIDKRNAVELVTYYKRIGRADLLSRMDIEYYSSHNINQLLNKLIKMQERPGQYVAGIMDGVTSLTASAVNWSLGFRPLSKSSDSGEKQKDNVLPDFDEYKVETSLVSQLLDLYKAQPWYNIWTAHPLPQIKIQGQGAKIQEITKTSTIVTYGNKVAGIIPGQFTEIYQFSRQAGKRVVWTDMEGDDFAKTSLPLPKMLDVDTKLFYEVWRDAVNNGFNKMEAKNEVSTLSIDSSAVKSKWQV